MRIRVAVRLWGYRVGTRQSWVDVWLQLHSYELGRRLSLRDAWRIASAFYAGDE
jgi:hypothetical protein